MCLESADKEKITSWSSWLITTRIKRNNERNESLNDFLLAQMNQDITNYVRTCKTFQKLKTHKGKNLGTLNHFFITINF